jgi:hypothetical protein
VSLLHFSCYQCGTITNRLETSEPWLSGAKNHPHLCETCQARVFPCVWSALELHRRYTVKAVTLPCLLTGVGRIHVPTPVYVYQRRSRTFNVAVADETFTMTICPATK